MLNPPQDMLYSRYVGLLWTDWQIGQGFMLTWYAERWSPVATNGGLNWVLFWEKYMERGRGRPQLFAIQQFPARIQML